MPDVPHLDGINCVDELVKFYKDYGGYVTAGSNENEYFIVRLPSQNRIHFYELSLHHHHPYHARFKSEGYYDRHSPHWVGPQIEERLRMGWEVYGCQVLAEYDPAGIYFGYALPGNEDGYLKHFWRIVFSDQTWIRCATTEATTQYIREHAKTHSVVIPG